MLVFCVALLYSSLLVRGLVFHHWRMAWATANIQATDNSFGDSRNLPLAVGVLRHGGDPYAVVPGSPYPPLNYPPAWLWCFEVLRLDAHFIAFELFMIAAFLLCIASLIYTASTLTGAFLCALCACTPAALLAVERGNTDLLVFSLCYLGVVLPAARGAWPALIAATLLKLFPAAGLMLWAVLKRSKPLILLSVFVVLTYAFVERHALNSIRKNTPVPGTYSYGAGTLAKDGTRVILHFTRSRSGLIAPATKLTMEGAFAGLGLYCFLRGRNLMARNGLRVGDPLEGRKFLIFSFLFLTTFLAGANYIYRLIFLLPTLPFLSSALGRKELRGLSLFALGMVLVGMSSAPGSPKLLEPVSFLARVALFGPFAYFFGVAWVAALEQSRTLSQEEPPPVAAEERSSGLRLGVSAVRLRAGRGFRARRA